MIDPLNKEPESASLAPSTHLDTFLTNSLKASTASLTSDDYRVVTPVFEGPLDLLLHLIRREQLNVYDIPIAKICQSYLEHLQAMCAPDVNIAGEFFVMAATLLHLKSQVLLPAEDRSDDEEDPRLPLVTQLLEYERFKKAAEQLDARNWLGRDMFVQPIDTTEILPVESLLTAPLEPVDTFQLLLSLKIALDRTYRPPINIAVDTTSLKDKILALGVFLEADPVLDFRTLMPPNPRRTDLILCFMAILELSKLRYIEILQTETFGPIQIRRIQSIKGLDMNLLEQF